MNIGSVIMSKRKALGYTQQTFNMAAFSFEIILSSRNKVPSKSVTYNVFIIKLFYPFRNHNIHTMLMWDSTAIAVIRKRLYEYWISNYE